MGAMKKVSCHIYVKYKQKILLAAAEVNAHPHLLNAYKLFNICVHNVFLKH